MEHILGISTMILCLAAALIGVPSLIIKYYREKRCGLTLINIIIMIAMLITRVGYCIAIEANYLIIPDAIGVGLFFILLTQYIIYHPSRIIPKDNQ